MRKPAVLASDTKQLKDNMNSCRDCAGEQQQQVARRFGSEKEVRKWTEWRVGHGGPDRRSRGAAADPPTRYTTPSTRRRSRRSAATRTRGITQSPRARPARSPPPLAMPSTCPSTSSNSGCRCVRAGTLTLLTPASGREPVPAAVATLLTATLLTVFERQGVQCVCPIVTQRFAYMCSSRPGERAGRISGRRR